MWRTSLYLCDVNLIRLDNVYQENPDTHKIINFCEIDENQYRGWSKIDPG